MFEINVCSNKILIQRLEQKVKGHIENNLKVKEGHMIYETQYYNLIKFIVTKLSQYMIFVTCKCHDWVSFLCHMTLQLISLSASTCINGFA